MLKPQSFESEIAGRKLTIETGKLAGQSNAAVTCRYGDTVVLVTVCIAETAREGVDFLPLTVDYEERLYAAGKIPGGFIRREGRPSQEATLAGRLIDRSIRPLLPKEWRKEIQVIITVLSADRENDPDVLAIIGASTVLSMSKVPFAGPLSAVNVGFLNGELILNPTLAQVEESELDLVVASSKDKIVMIEADAHEAQEDMVFRAIQFAHEANQKIIQLQEEIQQACGKKKQESKPAELNHEVVEAVSPILDQKIIPALEHTIKEERDDALAAIKAELIERFGQTFSADEIDTALDKRIRQELRNSILEKGKRVSGRALTEVRQLECEVGLLPRTHGSGLFTRGQTQVLTITTLGSTKEQQQLDGLGIEEHKRFMHHYNMPPFATGEVKRTGTPGRREIGHGALVERSLIPVLPKPEDFPYTIRLVSEVVSSSGSTSMGSVCASTLSLMDAGVPIKKPVAGIAMGLVTNDAGKFQVLTDIEGIEDNYGDMDFKVAGTADGVTGVQMDTKLKGLTFEIVEKTLYQAKEARLFILNVMNQTISAPRTNLSRYAPRMYKITINTDKIGTVIGPGGKTIRSIIDETKATIDISDDGTVLIGSPDEAAAQRAIEIIDSLTREIEVGAVYTGKVTRILNFGAMIEILPGKEGLVHISELADYRVASVEDIVKVGDEVSVKVIEIDNLGRVNLSRRALLAPEGEGGQPREYTPRPRESRPPQGRFPPRGGGRPMDRRPR